MRLGRLRRPLLGCLPWNLPLLPVAIKPRVQVPAQRLQCLLPPFPDDVDLHVVGNGLQGDVRNAFANEALPHVTTRGRLRWHRAADLRLLALPIPTVCKHVVWVASTHDPGTRERQGNPGGIDGDPTAAPLFRDVRRSAGSASRIENKITGIRRHRQAAGDYLGKMSELRILLDLQQIPPEYRSKCCLWVTL